MNASDSQVKTPQFATDFSGLGFVREQHAALNDLFSPSAGAGGVVLVAGECAAGVSATIRAAAAHYSDCSNAAASPAVVAQSVTTAALRAATDLFVMGEVRDRVGAKTMCLAADAGHTIFGSVKSESAIGILPRLESFGVSRARLARPGFVRGLVRQIVVPRLCPYCKVSHASALQSGSLSSGELARIARHFPHCSDQLFHRGPGCDDCEAGVARTGGVVCAEVISLDEYMLSLIAVGAFDEAHAHWQTTAGAVPRLTCAEHAVELLKTGVVALGDVEAAVGLIGTEVTL